MTNMFKFEADNDPTDIPLMLVLTTIIIIIIIATTTGNVL